MLPSTLETAAEIAEQAVVDWLAQRARRQEEQRPASSDATAQALREVVSQRHQAWAWEWGEVALEIHEDGRVTIDLPAQAKEEATQAGGRAVNTWQQQTAWLAMAHQALTAPTTGAHLGELPPLTIPQPAATAPVDIIDRLTQQMMGETTPFTGVGAQLSMPEYPAHTYEFMTTPSAA